MIKFMSLERLGLSSRIPGKIYKTVYCLEISASVSEIFKFEKCVKHANERTQSTQYNMKYTNRATLVNL